MRTRGRTLAAAAVPAGLLTGMLVQLLLLTAVAEAVAGLSAAGWAVGVACGVVIDAALAHGLAHYRVERLTTADWVTLARATLASCVAAVVASSFGRPVATGALVGLAATALALDAVDGWIARRTSTSRALGAQFDGEVDAFLILVLSVYVARSAGAWVLAIGLARYVFLVAGWLMPWMREPLPPRFWRKVVAATQGVVLAVAAAQVLPSAVTDTALAVALVLLAESFGRDVWWLRRNRAASRSRGRMAVALNILAALLVWVALVAPRDPIHLEPSAFVRIPLEGVVLMAIAALLPATARRILAWAVGPLLGLVFILKILDLGFFTAFDRPFDPYQDVGYAGIGSETLRASIGASNAHLVIAGLVLLVVALLVFTTLAVGRLSRKAAAHRRPVIQASAAVAVVWAVFWASGSPVASTSAGGLVVDKVTALRADLRDHGVFAAEIRRDRFGGTPAGRLLTRLRGKDVILAFVESYGRVAVQDSSFSPQVDAVLADGTTRLRAAGFDARSAWLTSPTYGGISWLAHSTMQSGLWVNTARRYDQLTKSNRLTLSDAFKQGGWRTVGDAPSDERAWGPGTAFYHFDQLYDRRNVGYRGPTYAYASMPDQYVFSALQRLELAKRHRAPVFAEVDLVSSHTPWTDIPRMVDWRRIGDGSVFNTSPAYRTSKDALWNDQARVRAAYGLSIRYTLSSLVSFVERYGGRNTVLVVLGDHQPSTTVSGLGASHDVPVSVIAHDPAVLRRVAGWGWNDGLRPDPTAPVWPMSAFRDRFFDTFGSRRAGG